MRISLAIFCLTFLLGCAQTAIIVCPKAANIQKCAEETLKHKIRILDVRTREQGVYEILYQVKDTLDDYDPFKF
jgi:hypothetical protein